MNMRHFAIIAGAIWLAATTTVHAQSKPVVLVELYTSQGCSSCPPADEFMGELVNDPQVVALALHVDYWDYIGWKDEFAQASFTERQQGYARAIGSRTIYTPQMIVNGDDRVEGNNPEAVHSYIKMHLMQPSGVELTLERDGDRLMVRAVGGDADQGPLTVNLARYIPEQAVAIERGENAGKTVTYHNVVTDLQTLGEWSGADPLEVEATVTGDAPVVVFLQKGESGVVLAAAQIK
jgi:hypothetical protein